MGKVVLVTGANGFVGRHLVSRLCGDSSYEVIATDTHENLVAFGNVDRERITYVNGKLDDDVFMESLRATYRFDTIVHLAGLLSKSSDPAGRGLLFDVNVRGTQRILECAAGGGARFIFPSTGLVYGNRAGPFTEDMDRCPRDFYALSKLLGEELIRCSSNMLGFEHVIFRPGILYGPGQRGVMFIPSLVHALVTGSELEMTGGAQTRDLVYVEDFVDALHAAIVAERLQGVFNIGTGAPVALRDIARLGEELAGVEGIVKLGRVPYREHEIWEYCLDSRRAREALGWEPKTALREGLRRAIEYETTSRQVGT